MFKYKKILPAIHFILIALTGFIGSIMLSCKSSHLHTVDSVEYNSSDSTRSGDRSDEYFYSKLKSLDFKINLDTEHSSFDPPYDLQGSDDYVEVRDSILTVHRAYYVDYRSGRVLRGYPTGYVNITANYEIELTKIPITGILDYIDKKGNRRIIINAEDGVWKFCQNTSKRSSTISIMIDGKGKNCILFHDSMKKPKKQPLIYWKGHLED